MGQMTVPAKKQKSIMYAQDVCTVPIYIPILHFWNSQKCDSTGFLYVGCLINL